eukprot:m.157887 g.157887  ORF g.157887 m.157887 type:complete len:955 (-) comp16458_c0_seq1:38-2902(-)
MLLELPLWGILGISRLTTMQSMCWILLTITATAVAQRETLSFDFAWRYTLGSVYNRQCGVITKDYDIGQGGSAITANSYGECCDACAKDTSCVAWDWATDTHTCWLKDNMDGNVSKSNRYTGTIPPPAGTPPAALPGYNADNWTQVDAPHDMLLDQPVEFANKQAQANIARSNGAYRKRFSLPTEWQGKALWIYFQAIYHVATVFVNGHLVTKHDNGYTSFAVRLDDVPNLVYGGGENILLVVVDASFGSEWWYPGGGLFRHQQLVATHPVHLHPDRAWAHGVVASANIVQRVSPSQGHLATSVSAVLEATVVNWQTSSASAVVRATVLDNTSTVVATVTSNAVSISAGGKAVVTQTATINNVELWSVPRPYLYTVEFAVLLNDMVVDNQSVSTGFRKVDFDADRGMFVNNQHVKVRGMCDHSNLGGVGAAVPDRVNLYRVQLLRNVGVNAWRMAHNPPVAVRLDYMDALGMLALDENREFGGAKQQGGTSNETSWEQLQDMADLVLRDRSHPSIMAWSFCNEVGCDNETAAASFRNITYQTDGTRPVTQNHHGTKLSTQFLDIQGFSHKHGNDFDEFHQLYPHKPTMATECCSCFSQRGEDADLTPADKTAANASRPGLFYNNLIQECTASQVNTTDSRDYVSGTFVWSGFDYMGEAQGWPQIIKCRGTIADVAGFPKETGAWFKAWWLANISTSDAGRPNLPQDDTVYIVESWQPPVNGSNRTIHVYSNLPMIELRLNGNSQGTQAMPFFGMVTFTVPYQPGELLAVGYDSAGTAVANSTRYSPGSGYALQLSLDAPSPTTGTGSRLVLDGEDTAMVRCTIVDSQGHTIPSATHNVTFSILSGPGRVIGTHNGDPASHVVASSLTRPAYHGLVRAFVRTTTVAIGSQSSRLRLSEVDLDHDSVTKVDTSATPSVDAIVLQATVPSLQLSTTLTIETSVDVDDLAGAVARRVI